MAIPKRAEEVAGRKTPEMKLKFEKYYNE